MGSFTLTALAVFGLLWVIQCKDVGQPLLQFAHSLHKEGPYQSRAENVPYLNEVEGASDEPTFQHPAALNLLSSSWTTPNNGQFAPVENVKPFHYPKDLADMKSDPTGPSGIPKIFPILPKLIAELVEPSSNNVRVMPSPPSPPMAQGQTYGDLMKAGPVSEPPVALPPSIPIHQFMEAH